MEWAKILPAPRFGFVPPEPTAAPEPLPTGQAAPLSWRPRRLTPITPCPPPPPTTKPLPCRHCPPA
uniref:Uncharacterized protein n=1 Tax=mine drainage metagenome TaxID=410659 RepID=E6PMF6_9ZZZZ